MAYYIYYPPQQAYSPWPILWPTTYSMANGQRPTAFLQPKRHTAMAYRKHVNKKRWMSRAARKGRCCWPRPRPPKRRAVVDSTSCVPGMFRVGGHAVGRAGGHGRDRSQTMAIDCRLCPMPSAHFTERCVGMRNGELWSGLICCVAWYVTCSTEMEHCT